LIPLSHPNFDCLILGTLIPERALRVVGAEGGGASQRPVHALLDRFPSINFALEIKNNN